MAEHLDPLGRRALFWLPVDAQVTVDHGEEPAASAAERPPTGPRRARPAGKHALYSAATPAGDRSGGNPAATASDPLPRRGALRVECSSCGSVTRMGLFDFALLQLPIGWWIPGKVFDHRMTCPVCRRRVWTSVTVAP